ncbi:MAG: sensor histidine kinase [Cyclobacteriaceae bacterium]
MMKLAVLHIGIFCITSTALIQTTSAQDRLDSLKKIYHHQSDTVKLETLRKLSEATVKQNDSLVKYAQIGLEESRLLKNSDYEGKFLMYLSLGAENSANFELAINYGKTSVQKFEENSNTVWAAGMSRAIADIFIRMLQYDSAMYYAIKSLDYHAKLKVNPGTLETLSTIAHIHELNGNLDQSLEWSRKMLILSQSNNFEYYEAEAYYNLGNIYDLKKDYDSAIYFKQLALKSTSDVKSNNFASLIGNLGNSFMMKGALDSALYYTTLFYNLSRDENKTLYRRDERKALSAINLGALYFKMGRIQKSKDYLNEGLILSKAIDYKEKLQDANLWLYQIAIKEKRYEEALAYYLAYATLYQESINAENQKVIQQLTFQYDTKQKAQEIAMLKLENKIIDSNFTQIQNRFYLALLGIIMITIIGILLYTRMQLKQRALLSEEMVHHQKARFKSVIEAEEKERKRIAAELHDGLGQLLSSARLNVAALEGHLDEVKSKQISNSIKLLDNAVNEVRGISHNMMPNVLISIGFESALQEQVHMINDTGKFKVHLTVPENKIVISEELAISLYRIAQEILNNALKYSNAKNIWITIQDQFNNLKIEIKDDGKGFDTAVTQNGNGIGWENINSRVEVINGDIRIDSGPEKGTSVLLNVAL